MLGLRATSIALGLSLAGQTALAGPIATRQTECAELSTTTPNWQITNAISSDWPGGGGGRVSFFARHVPTRVLSACNVEYRLEEDGTIVDYDPTASHACTNFVAESPLNTTVRLDMDALLLTLQSSWACEGDERASYSASGKTTLNRDTSPGACLVEPTMVGDSTTCPIADVEVEGELGDES